MGSIRLAYRSRRALYFVLIAVVVIASGMLGAGTASASGLPRLYSGVATRGGDYVDVFKVRPRRVSVSCADGGELVVSWRSWTKRSASGVGHLRPCRGGGGRIKVKAFRPRRGYFTRLTVRYKVDRKWVPNQLGLARQLGTTWIRVSWMFNPDSGASPWPS